MIKPIKPPRVKTQEELDQEYLERVIDDVNSSIQEAADSGFDRITDHFPEKICRGLLAAYESAGYHVTLGPKWGPPEKWGERMIEISWNPPARDCECSPEDGCGLPFKV